MADMTVGFVGIGNMGEPMARCVAAGGFAVVAYDIAPAAAAALADVVDSVSVAPDLPALGARSDIVITMLPDAAVVRLAALGDETHGTAGFAAAMRAGTAVVDMSSSAPLETRALGAVLAARQIALVDAPVSGGVPRARTGSLTIMTGGEPDAIALVEPVLATMGTVQRTGALGTGHAMKALNNYVSAAGLIAVCEALVVAERFGLDPHTVNAILDCSTGRNNTTERKVESFMLNGAFNSGFALDLLRKDVAIADSLARDLGVPAPWLAACAGEVAAAQTALGLGADHTAIYEHVLTRAKGRGPAPEGGET